MNASDQPDISWLSIFTCITLYLRSTMLAIRHLLTSRVANRSGYCARFAAFSTEAVTNAVQNSSDSTASNLQINASGEKDKLYSRLEIELRGIDPAVLKSYSLFAITAANHLSIEIGNCWAPRKAHHDRLTLLKSVHIYKKHRVQYEIRTHFRFLNFHKLTGSTLDSFLEYIERNLPEGVALNATRVEIQDIPEHLREPPSEE